MQCESIDNTGDQGEQPDVTEARQVWAWARTSVCSQPSMSVLNSTKCSQASCRAANL